MSELITISGVRGFIDENGTAQLHIEDVSRGLGFTETRQNGAEYIRWGRVNEYLASFNFATSGENEFIPENIFYRLAMKAKNETAEKFQAIVADEILPAIRKTGVYSTNSTQSKTTELEIKNKNAEARLKNAQTRQANFLLENTKKYSHLLCKEAMSLLTVNAFEMIAGKNTLPKPKLAEIKYYTATEIGDMVSRSSQAVGKIANANGLKTEQYGIMVLDKSAHSSKQIPSFKYNEAGKDKLLELIRQV